MSSGASSRCGKGLGPGLEQLREAGEDVAEQARDAQGDVDARPAQQRQREDLEAGDAAGALVPLRGEAGQMQRHGEFLARRAHGGAAPEVDHQPARIVAVVLQVAADQFLGQLDALGMGVARGHGAGIDAEEVAPGGQHIAAAPVGRACRAGRHAAAVQGGEQALASRPAPCAEDVQAVAELAFLDVADEAVDPGDRLGGGGVGGKAEVGRDARGLRLIADRGDQAGAAGGVEAVGGGVFVEQPFQRAPAPAGSALATSGGGRWPRVTAPMRRLACAASPGSLTMKG